MKNFKIGIKTLFVLLTLFTVSVIIILTYTFSKRGLNELVVSESKKYFEQSTRLAQTIFDYEIEKVFSVVNSISLSEDEQKAIKEHNIRYLENQLNKSIVRSLDFMAIIPSEYDDIALGGFFLYDISPLIDGLKRVKTSSTKKHLMKITSNNQHLVFIIITKGIVDRDTGEVIGLFIGGVELKNNIKLLTDIKKNTKLEKITLLYKDDVILEDNEYNSGFVNIDTYGEIIHSNNMIDKLGFRSALSFDEKESALNVKMILKNDAVENVKGIIKRDLLIISIFTLIAVIAFIILINKLLIQPIESLKVYAKEFFDNNNSEQKELTLKIVEYQELANYLKQLFKELYNNQQKLLKAKQKIDKDYKLIQELNDNLEQKVEQKTRELQDLNDNLTQKVKLEVENNRKKDQQMMQQARYAALGEMIANIAHQWRQPLCAISAAISAVKLQKDLKMLNDETFDYYYHMMVSNTEFLSETINTFRSFFKNDLEKKPFNLVKSIEDTLMIVSSSFKDNDIKIKTDFSHQELMVLGSSTELSQVFINILNNAKDVMVEKEVKDRRIFIRSVQIEEENIIFIIDNGGGIPEDIIQKIFDPYFTTKHQSQGTGIGLYMSKEIIERKFNGFLNVQNTQFRDGEDAYVGACFRIALPATNKILKDKTD